MADVVVVGGGICGLGTAMMLARRGHQVTVLERNAEPPPATIEEAWESWERPGVGQFHMGHYFLARFHSIVKAELPELIPQFEKAGALRLNAVVDAMPPSITDRSARPGDEELDVVTGRRPVFEWVVARAAAEEAHVDIRRGVAVEGVVTGPSVVDGVPHVVGVRTSPGDTLAADIVLDAGGRRSAFSRWLDDIGARPFLEESEDSGFRYYGRYYRARPTGWPGPAVPMIVAVGSIGVIELPGDNDTWMLGVVTSAKDRQLYGLSDDRAWQAVVAATPAIAPYLDGEPITDLETMVAIPDRYRRFVVDNRPVATGIAAIADAWAATNPMRGRGISMGFAHAQSVIGHLDKLDSPLEFALAVDATTEAELAPHYHGTIQIDREMRDAFDREVAGLAASEEQDPMAAVQSKFMALATVDADAWRGLGRIINLLDLPMNVVASEPLFSKVLDYDGELVNPMVGAGPSRQDLLDIAKGATKLGRVQHWDEVGEAV